MSELGLKLAHIKEMKHMVGLDYKSPRRGKYEAYRNEAGYYAKNPPKQALDLVEWGLASVTGESYLWFKLTRAGRRGEGLC